MSKVEHVKTVCRSCHGGCEVIAHVQDGKVIKVIKVEGDSDSPISDGTLCAKGLAITQLSYYPDRILYPMKKTGGNWERITWEEALAQRTPTGSHCGDPCSDSHPTWHSDLYTDSAIGAFW